MKAHDIPKITKRFKGNIYNIHLDIRQWKTFKSRQKFNWDCVRFSPNNKNTVPREPGIYAFVVSWTPSKAPPHGYILYIGIAGHTKSTSTLRARYTQYLREQRNASGRPRVVFMLNEWKEDLFFYYAPLPNSKSNLRMIESRMISAIIPPVNQKDFDTYIDKPRRAAF